METDRATDQEERTDVHPLRTWSLAGAGCRRALVEVTQLLVEARLERASAFAGSSRRLIRRRAVVTSERQPAPIAAKLPSPMA